MRTTTPRLTQHVATVDGRTGELDALAPMPGCGHSPHLEGRPLTDHLPEAVSP